MRILVTGAAGFIGSHLAEKLVTLGHEVVGLDSFNSYYDRDLKELNAQDVCRKGAQIKHLDLATDDLDAALDGAEVIYHAAAQPGISATTAFEDYLRNNIVATQRLAAAALKLPDLRCFVNVATSSVYGREATEPETAAPKPTSYYGVTKLAAEQLVMAYHRDQGLPACSLRLFSVYGPRERPEKLFPYLIDSILSDREFPLYEGSKEHSRTFTYVGDIVDGFTDVLDNLDKCNGEIFNIGSDVEITTGRGIEIVEEILGKQVKLNIVPKRPGDQVRTSADITKAKKVLGYAPKTQPEEGLRKEVEWYEEKVYGKIDLYSA